MHVRSFGSHNTIPASRLLGVLHSHKPLRWRCTAQVAPCQQGMRSATCVCAWMRVTAAARPICRPPSRQPLCRQIRPRSAAAATASPSRPCLAPRPIMPRLRSLPITARTGSLQAAAGCLEGAPVPFQLRCGPNRGRMASAAHIRCGADAADMPLEPVMQQW